MKRILESFALLLAFTFLICSCTPEQTEYKIEDITTFATVEGRVSYSVGMNYVNNHYLAEEILPAEGKVIHLEIPYSYYQTGATGVKDYSAVIDAEGRFSFQVPIVRGQAATLRLFMDDFIGQKRYFKKMEGGQPTFETATTVYSLSRSISGIEAGNIKTNTYRCTALTEQRDVLFKESVPIVGTVTKSVENGYLSGALVAADGANLLVKVDYPSFINKSGVSVPATSVEYGVTTDQLGAFKMDIPMRDLSQEVVQVTLTPVSYVENSYKHYPNADGSVTQISGVRGGNSEVYSNVNVHKLEGIEYIVKSNIGFVPFSPAPSTYHTNLLGWQTPSASQKMVPVSGTLYLAMEEVVGSTIKGEWTRSKAKGYSVRIGSDDYLFATASDGRFEIRYPVAKSATAANIQIVSEQVSDFYHYTTPVVGELIGGYYSPMSATSFNIKDGEIKTGSIYMRFNPTITPSNWWSITWTEPK